MTSAERIGRHVQARREHYLDTLRALVRRNREGEDAVQAYVAERFAALGGRVATLDYRPRELEIRHELTLPATVEPNPKRNVVARFPGRGRGRSLLLFAHPDGEPRRHLDRWTRPLFDGLVEDGRMYGWGVADDLVGVALLLAGMEALRGAGLELRGEAILASCPSKNRAQGIIHVLDSGYLADAALYLHPAESGAGLDEIKAIASGLLKFRLTLRGRPPETHEPGHTVFAHLADDPVAMLNRVLAVWERLARERAARVRYPPLDEAVGRATNLLIAHIRYGEEEVPTRVSPTLVLTGSIAFPPGEDMRAVQREYEGALEALVRDDPLLQRHPPDLEWLVGIGGSAIPLDHPLYRTVAEAIAEVAGLGPHVNPLHTASDIRNPNLHRGIPTVGIGPLVGDLAQAGRHDEWVDVEDYLRAVGVVAAILADWCGVESEAEGGS